MFDEVQLASRLSIREAGYDDYWLQDQIYKNPACLGLGELDALAKERSQVGGRLDILLKDSEDDTMYEVEVMVGETDETHIIRTIEYWDNEKRRWPQRQHIAVLIAEQINRRFFNVIHLLSHSIPIVAIQVALLQTLEKRRSLFFTKVLDTYEEVDDGMSIQENAYSYQDIVDYVTDPATNQEFEKILADLRAMGTEMRPYRAGKYRWLEFFYGGKEVAYLGTLHKAFKSQHYDPDAEEWVKPVVMVTHTEWEQRSKPWIAKLIRPIGK